MKLFTKGRFQRKCNPCPAVIFVMGHMECMGGGGVGCGQKAEFLQNVLEILKL